MNTSQVKRTEGLTVSGIALVVTQLFRLLFGGYLIGFDLYYYNDPESAFSVLVIYAIIGILTVLFMIGRKRTGLIGLIALSIILLIMQTIYIAVYFSEPVPDPSWHSPLTSWWATVSNFLFPFLTLIFAIMVRYENWYENS
ncbi:MAG: hypothetical protein ACFFED_11615 [Candidatus Thorarchaeota archaeon]